jgi:multiple sugar transport system permease protein
MRDSPIKYFLLFPAVALITVTTLLPIVQVINISLQQWVITQSLTPGPYIGFDNYTRAFQDPEFWNAVWVTFIYTLITAFFSIMIGLIIAITLQRTTPITGFIKAILIFPFAISLTLRGYSFRFMLLDGSGILDVLLDFFFPMFSDILWLGEPASALFWLCVGVFWSWGPLSGLMLLGALNNIPTDIFEAARVDGAGNWRIFWSITLPLLRPMILVVVLLITLFSIRMFDLVQTMTAGGPGRATETLNFFIYRVGFRFFDMGYASALAMLLTVVLIILSYLYSRILMD